VYSYKKSGNSGKCPFCNSDRADKTDEEDVEEIMKRAEANDAASIFLLATCYYQGIAGLQQDQERAMELFTKSAELGFSKAHSHLGDIYFEGGDLRKAKFHFEAAAMAGDDVARFNIGSIEFNSGNIERALKHWTIGASAGHYDAMYNLLIALKKGDISRELVNSTLEAYNNSCAEMRSEDRDAYICTIIETI
jgi:TPR repeat protein